MKHATVAELNRVVKLCKPSVFDISLTSAYESRRTDECYGVNVFSFDATPVKEIGAYLATNEKIEQIEAIG